MSEFLSFLRPGSPTFLQAADFKRFFQLARLLLNRSHRRQSVTENLFWE
jgi:hypothetical protein